eukprot:6180037-Pleurochrysis_carterae.AAC.3
MGVVAAPPRYKRHTAKSQEKRPYRMVEIDPNSQKCRVVSTTDQVQDHCTRKASFQLRHGTRSQSQRTWPRVLYVNHTLLGRSVVSPLAAVTKCITNLQSDADFMHLYELSWPSAIAWPSVGHDQC